MDRYVRRNAVWGSEKSRKGSERRAGRPGAQPRKGRSEGRQREIQHNKINGKAQEASEERSVHEVNIV